MTFNAGLAREVLAAIEAAPAGEWDQVTWRCETGQCFAGWTALMSGWTWVEPVFDPDSNDRCMVIRNGETEFVEQVAERELGFEHNSGYTWNLFAPDNSLVDLRIAIAELEASDA